MTISISAARTTQLSGQTNNPFFAWDNLAKSAGVTYGGIATLADGAAVNAFTDMTTEYWRPNITATTAGFWVIFPAAVEIQFAAIAAHNLATLGGTVVLQYSTNSGSTWASAGAAAVTPADNAPIAFRVASGVSATHWRWWFTGLTAGAPLYVGAAHMGTELVMPSRFYADFAPPIVPSEVALQANITDGGQFAGTSVIAKGTTMTAPFQHLTPAFVRGTFKPFMSAWNAGGLAFFAWRPATFPDDVRLVRREGDAIRPQNMGVLDFMAATVSMRAHEA